MDWPRTCQNCCPGRWTGTMCLTEPHCSMPSAFARKAVPDADGSYAITGTKIFIPAVNTTWRTTSSISVLARAGSAKGAKAFPCSSYQNSCQKTARSARTIQCTAHWNTKWAFTRTPTSSTDGDRLVEWRTEQGLLPCSATDERGASGCGRKAPA